MPKRQLIFLYSDGKHPAYLNIPLMPLLKIRLLVGT